MPSPRASDYPLDVAAAVIRDDQGRVLINQRPPGKPMAGKWEFPGGKINAGETVRQALARELHEELGIELAQDRPLIEVSHDYGERRVNLHVREVLAYSGVPEGLEDQPLQWIDARALADVDLLAANTPIVRAVQLPRVCLITDTARYGSDATLERLARHVRRQRVLLIIREKALPREALEAFARAAAAVCRPAGSMVVLHAHAGRVAMDALDGFHYPARALGADPGMPGGRVAGYSCHDARELALAAAAGADYVLLSPLRPTPSHPDAAGMGWEQFAALARPASMPVYALGGLSRADFETAIDHGAQGAAMLGAAWGAG